MEYNFNVEEKLTLEYALITDSSLPKEVSQSEYFISVDKKQWLDLVDYSEGLVKSDPSQEIMFLIVAKGTPEQEAEDAKRRKKEQEKLDKLYKDKSAAEQALFEKEEAEKQRLRLLEEERNELREKSKSIFNALYKR